MDVGERIVLTNRPACQRPAHCPLST